MSSLEEKLRDLLIGYLAEEMPVETLRASHVGVQLEAAAGGDAEALLMADEIEVLFAEFSSGDRSESSLRSEFRDVLSVVKPMFSHQPDIAISYGTSSPTFQSVPLTPQSSGIGAVTVSW